MKKLQLGCLVVAIAGALGWPAHADPPVAAIGLQDRGAPVHFRNIRIKRLPDQVRGPWQPLLGGKDLAGWIVSDKCPAACCPIEEPLKHKETET